LSALAFMTVATLGLAACSGGDGANAEAAELESVSTMVPYLVTNAPSEDNEIETALEEIAEVDLDITWVPNSSFGDKTNITLAGDDIPQVMIIQGKDPGFVRNAEAGAFWDLTDILADYPNLKT